MQARRDDQPGVAMKRQFSLEALYAFVFAVCVLAALFLLAS